MQCNIQFKHRTASLFTFRSKYGQLQFGTKYATEKFKSEFFNNDEWQVVFDDDQDELIESVQIDEEGDIDTLNHARGTMLAKKLPAYLNLMIYSDRWTCLTEEILKQYWFKGGEFKCVKWGDPDFEPSFWLREMWAWQEVTKHPNNRLRSDYTGPGNITEFTKKVVKNRLEMLGLNHENRVMESFTEEDRKKRERSKKKSKPSEIERAFAEDITVNTSEVNRTVPEKDSTTSLDDVFEYPHNESGLSNLLHNNGIDVNNLSTLNVSNI